MNVRLIPADLHELNLRAKEEGVSTSSLVERYLRVMLFHPASEMARLEAQAEVARAEKALAAARESLRDIEDDACRDPFSR